MKKIFQSIVSWFDAHAGLEKLKSLSPKELDKIDWFRAVPFIAMQLMCLGVFWVGFSWIALATAVALYVIRMFAITGFYHRYFSHKTFRTSRPVQFIFGLVGASSVQRGPLWWAAHHRTHHKLSDLPGDPHSPVLYGFWKSHMGWFMTRRHFPTNFKLIPDLTKYPELIFLNRFDIVVPVVLAFGTYYFGKLLQIYAPHLGTNGPQMLIWGFFISTTALFHGTATINSLSHLFGWKRFKITDESRNNPLLAIITLGEGWHNNHHRYQSATRQGFYWWEYDFTYYALKVLSWFKIITHIKPVSQKIYQEVRDQKALKKLIKSGQITDLLPDPTPLPKNAS